MKDFIKLCFWVAVTWLAALSLLFISNNAYADNEINIIIKNKAYEKVLVRLNNIDHGKDYPLPIIIFCGEIKPRDKHVMLPRVHNKKPHRYMKIIEKKQNGRWVERHREIIKIEPPEDYFVIIVR